MRPDSAMFKPADYAESGVAENSSLSEAGLPSAQAASDQLLMLAGIERIVCVDDWYTPSPLDATSVVAALADGLLQADDVSNIAAVSSRLSFLRENDLPEDLAARVVGDAWESLEIQDQQRVLDIVRARTGATSEVDSGEQDNVAAQVLRSLLSQSRDFITLPLSEWRRRGKELLEDGKNTLVLFDRDFSREGAGENAGEIEVERLLRQAPSNWRIGMLTHTVTDSSSEIAAWRSLSRKFSADSSRFLVIAKERLASNPDGFPRMLKLTLLAPALELIQKQVHKAVEVTWKEAVERVASIDPYTLEAALTGDRHTDGTWGPETLLRITSAFTQNSVRARLRAQEEIHQSGTLIYTLSTVALPATSDLARIRQELAEIERLEYFESAEHLSQLHFPLEPGDIFVFDKFVRRPHEYAADDWKRKNGHSDPDAVQSDQVSFPALSGSPKYMILLAQPCDLAVRSNGKRGNDISFARMAPLKPPASGRRISGPGGEKAVAFDLPYFDAESGEGVEVRLSQQQYVPLSALDMCVFNADGRAAMSIDDTPPRILLPNWKNRFSELAKWTKKTVRSYASMKPHNIPSKGADVLTQALAFTSASPGLDALISTEAGAIFYAVRRVGRLREPYRSALLSRAAHRDARDAFDPSLIDKGVPDV